MVEQGTHKPLVPSSNLGVATASRCARSVARVWFFNRGHPGGAFLFWGVFYHSYLSAVKCLIW